MDASRIINPNAVPKSANRKALYKNPLINNIIRLCGAYYERQPYGASRGFALEHSRSSRGFFSNDSRVYRNR